MIGLENIARVSNAHTTQHRFGRKCFERGRKQCYTPCEKEINKDEWKLLPQQVPQISLHFIVVYSIIILALNDVIPFLLILPFMRSFILKPKAFKVRCFQEMQKAVFCRQCLFSRPLNKDTLNALC